MGQSRVFTTQYVDGDPNGIRVCMAPDMLTTAVLIPRSKFERATRLELPRRGIYFLVKGRFNSAEKVCVGLTTQGVERLDGHARGGEWWEAAVLFLADDEDMLSLEALACLEDHFLKKAAATSGVAVVDNKLEPKHGIGVHDIGVHDIGVHDIGVRDIPALSSIYGEIDFVMTALGYARGAVTSDAISSTGPADRRDSKPARSWADRIAAPVSMTVGTITANGVYNLRDGTVTVHRGSSVDMDPMARTTDRATSERRRELIGMGALEVQADGDRAVLTDDVVFKSPTAAARFVLGRQIRGDMYWKTTDGRTIKEAFW